MSVVLPTYNRRPLLFDAIESVRAQTFTDWELIVVDDGSTDGTRGYLEALQAVDARIRPIVLPHAGTATVARSVGVRAARGEWIAFLDSDDVWLPRKLALQLEQLSERPACDWSYTGYSHVDVAGRASDDRRPPLPAPVSGWIIEPLLTFTAAAAIPTVLVRRTLFDEVGGFDQALRLRSDYDLMLRLATRSEACAVPETLVLVRDHDGRTTRAFPLLAQLEENELVFRKAWRASRTGRVRALCARQRAAEFSAMAAVLGREGHHGAAWRAVANAVRVAPGSSRVWRAAGGLAARQAGLRR